MDTTTIDVEAGSFFLGPVVDPASGDAVEGDNIIYEAADFTTHGVIVGMTGSGKTGLGMVLLEEALLQGIPTLVIDPKGDMGNLLLTFPDLSPNDFRPWINEGEAQRDGVTPDDLAASTAELWENGLAGSGIGKDRIAALRKKADFTIYTPGSTAGVPLNVIGDLSAPESTVDEESMREEIDGLVQGLLALVDVKSDPLSGREHVLLANLINQSWSAGTDLDLARLLAQIQDPPMRKLGVIELDTFFPPSDRTALAMKLNGLLASPSFAAWGEGVPLDIASMLESEDGRPRAAIVSIAHLSDEERQFAVTLILSKLVTWMRSQPGSPDLRALVYMDEVFGFVPPTAEPPAKRPILTILKQARAFGVGMVLSTQNPVDLDYKAISNAGTWMIGRLQTERDKARLLEGMRAAGGDADIDAIGDIIGGLGKRRFLLHTTRGGAPTTFGTRWAMSYLPGPLTRDQIGVLMADRQLAPPASSPAAPAATSTATSRSDTGLADTGLADTGLADTGLADTGLADTGLADTGLADTGLADNESTVAPEVADGVEVAYLDPAAPWSDQVGAVAGGRRLQSALVARVRLLFDETKGDLRHEAEWEAVVFPLGSDVDGADFVAVDYDDRDLRPDPPAGAIYVLPDAKIHTKTFFKTAQRVLKDHLYRSERLSLLRNDSLKLYSRVGETAEEFATRCARAADDRADEEADELRKSMAKKEARVRAAIAKAEDRLRELESDSKDRKRNEVLSGAIDVIGGLFGGRKSSRSILSGVRRASSSRRTSANADQRVATAENRLAEKADDLVELADALTDALQESQDAWEEAAENVVSYEVGLEKTDIAVEDLLLVWIPTD
jgi:Helicase HerA, central domain